MSDQTFEQMWKRLQVYNPELPTPLAQEFINTAYSRTLSYGGWSALRVEQEFRVPEWYNTGSVTVTTNSQIVVGSGTAFDSTMLYRQFLPGAVAPVYTIVSVDSTTQLTLDRPFLGETAAGSQYLIAQMYLEVPSDFLSWEAVRDLTTNWRLRTNWQQIDLDWLDAKRINAGLAWVIAAAPPRLVSASGVPLSVPIRRYEFWPRPSGPRTYAYRYGSRPPLLSAASDRAIFPVRGDLLRKGAMVELCLWPGTDAKRNPFYNLEQHAAAEREFQDSLKDAWREEQELSQSAIRYTDWSHVPFAPMDARFLQTHDMMLTQYW